MRTRIRIPRAMIASLAVLALVLPILAAGDTPAPATELVSKAQTKATQEGKTIFVVFDASW